MKYLLYLLYLLGFVLVALVVHWGVWQLLVGVLFSLIASVFVGVIQLVFGAVIHLAVLWALFKVLGYFRSLGIIPKD